CAMRSWPRARTSPGSRSPRATRSRSWCGERSGSSSPVFLRAEREGLLHVRSFFAVAVATELGARARLRRVVRHRALRVADLERGAVFAVGFVAHRAPVTLGRLEVVVAVGDVDEQRVL